MSRYDYLVIKADQPIKTIAFAPKHPVKILVPEVTPRQNLIDGCVGWAAVLSHEGYADEAAAAINYADWIERAASEDYNALVESLWYAGWLTVDAEMQIIFPVPTLPAEPVQLTLIAA